MAALERFMAADNLPNSLSPSSSKGAAACRGCVIIELDITDCRYSIQEQMCWAAFLRSFSSSGTSWASQCWAVSLTVIQYSNTPSYLFDLGSMQAGKIETLRHGSN